MRLNDYFDAVFCIYLEKRKNDWYHPQLNEWVPGRYPQAVAEFKKHGIEVEFVAGIDGELLDFPQTRSAHDGWVSKGDMGCVMSHLKVLQIARERKLKNYFVFEDDAVLCDNFNELFEKYIDQVPSHINYYYPHEWDMIYLGGNHDGGFKYGNPSSAYDWDLIKDSPEFKREDGMINAPTWNVVKLFNTFTTHAIGVNHTIFDALEKVLKQTEKVDVSVASLHKDFECFGFRPHLAWQRFSYSDILNRHADYDHLKNGKYSYSEGLEKWVQTPAEP